MGQWRKDREEIYMIYVIRFPNGKLYVGYTKFPLAQRKAQHYGAAKQLSNYLVHKALRKYGKENVIWESMFVSNDKAETLQMEKYYIELYQSRDHLGKGYNSTDGGEEGTNRKWTSESKQRMSEVKTKQFIENPEIRKKMSEAKKGITPWNKGKKTGRTDKPDSFIKARESRIKNGTWGGKPKCPIKIIDKDGIEYIFDNIAESSRKMNIPDTVIRVYSQKNKEYNGYRFIRL